MNKDTFYFSHDYNARSDSKILELRAVFGAEGYGIYWMLIETMAENADSKINKNHIAGLSLSYGIAKDRLEAIINLCVDLRLFILNENLIYSERLNDHKEFRKGRSTDGKRGADKRWENYRANKNSLAITEPKPSNSSPNTKERKGKDNKENNIDSGFLEKEGEALEEFFREITLSDVWRDSVKRQFKITDYQFVIAIDKFKAMVIVSGEKHSLSNLKRYFSNWLPKNKENLFASKQTVVPTFKPAKI